MIAFARLYCIRMFCPQAGQASLPQRSCAWANLTPFDYPSQGCLCGNCIVFLFFPSFKSGIWKR